MKLCTKCSTEKPIEDFHVRGIIQQPWCKSCKVVYDRNHTREYRLRKRVVTRVRRTERTEWLWALKSKPCMDCNTTFHPIAMQWDHRPGTIKLFNVSEKVVSYSKERVLKEIEKCDLVCANCHAVRTHIRRGLAQLD